MTGSDRATTSRALFRGAEDEVISGIRGDYI